MMVSKIGLNTETLEISIHLHQMTMMQMDLVTLRKIALAKSQR